MDVVSQRSAASSFLLASVIAIVFAWRATQGHPEVVIAVLMVMTAFLPIYLFATDERGHFDALFSILPISRRRVVVARFLGLTLVMVIFAAVSVGIAEILSRTGGTPIAPRELATVASCSFVAASLMIAVQMPVYFAMGAARAGMYPRAFVFAAIFGSTLLTGQIDEVPTWVLRAAASSWLGPVGVLVGLMILAISLAISVRLYTRRTL